MNAHSPELFDAFVFDVHDALGSFEQATYQLREAYHPQTFKDLSVIAHRIKGAAALYSYPQVSRLAELVERLIEHGEKIPAHQVPKLQNFLEQVAVCMRGSLEGITERGKEGPIGLQLVALGASQLFRELLEENPEIFVRHQQNLQTQSGVATDLHTQLQQGYLANKESWEFFAPEAREYLDTIEAILEESQTTPEHIHQLFRSTHTLKGAAYMLDFKVMGDLSHQLEDVMVMVREGNRIFDEPVKEAIKQGSQVLRLMIAYAEGQTNHVSELYSKVKGLLDLLLGVESPLVTSLRHFKQANQDIWEYFKPEVQEQLDTFNRAWNEIQHEGPSEERLNHLFRSMHTIKGAAYTVGLPSMGDVAKQAEHLTRELREGELEFADINEVLKQGHAALSQMLDSADGQATQVDHAVEQFRSFNLQGQTTNTVQQTIKETTIRVGLSKIEGLMNLANEMVMTRSRLEQQLMRFQEMSQALEVSRLKMLRTTRDFEEKYLNPRLREVNEGIPSAKHDSGLRTSFASTFNELELDSYNDLNIVARSISEMGSDLNEVQQQFDRFKRDFGQDLDMVERLSRNLRAEVSRTRLMPVVQLFQRLKRLIKDDADKQYKLEIKGESVELDVAILESINDSMIHLVKNAITHGIETREERLRLGKSPLGRITLQAYPQSNSVIIEVSDDGAGINLEAVKTQAVARGLRSAQDVASLDDCEAARLVFLAGLSTAKEVTVHAGRGVGMDVVMTQIKSLGGDVNITTRAGQGTTFQIRVPLTLLVSEALLVKVGPETLAFPINTVKTLRYVPVQQLAAEQVTIGEQLLPLYHTHALLGLPNTSQAEKAVVVLETHNGDIAMVVDEFIRIEEISMRRLGKLLSGMRHLAGATFSSQGKIILLLDPNGLIKLSQQVMPEQTTVASVPVSQSLTFLLVDDSISVRKIVGKMLERNGYSVVSAHDGQEALDILRRQQFDAILTDLEMPRLNGYELIEDVRRTWNSDQLPIVVMTTRAGEKHRQLALELGANYYFSKPIDESKLLNFLRGLKISSARLNS
jgi:chemosensory pili system protein ChpA (sensor histidine kinase/response regulator)